MSRPTLGALAIIGAGGHGRVVADTAEACGYGPVTFLDAGFPQRKTSGPWPITGQPRRGSLPLFCAIGDNATRARVFAELALDDTPVLVHPAATVSAHATLGAGTLVVASAVVNACAVIGRGGILNTGCGIDHDCTLGDFVHISPGAHLAGGVTIGARSRIGIGAVVREGVTIGADVIVGAGAAVVEDIADGQVMTGVPAKPLRDVRC